MDKIKRDNDGRASIADVLDRIDDIVDWINAQDERGNEQREAYKQLQSIIMEHGPPTIEEELEAGLEKHNSDNPRYPDGPINTCTAIFLPEANWEEWELFCAKKPQPYSTAAFHGIPVKSTNDTKITYHCGD